MLPTIAVILLALLFIIQLSYIQIENKKIKSIIPVLMNILFVASLVLIAVDQLNRGKTENMHLSSKNAELTILTMDRCGYCKKLKANVIPELRKQLPNLKITVLDDKHSDFKALSKTRKATGYPHAYINNQDIVGYMPPEKYVEKVKSLM